MMTMGKMNHYLIMLYLASCLFFISHSQTTSNTSSQHHCLPDQSSALLQLRQEFVQKRLHSEYWYSYDYYNENGHVVGLNLSNSWLSGTLKSNSSLFNLRHLQKLNLALNDFSSSTIPSQFGQLSLPELQILVLRANAFQGPIWDPHTKFSLSKLHVIDISHNNFFGKLPSEYFKTWNAMIMVPNKDKSQPEYMRSASNYYSLRIVNKGIEMEFVKILIAFKAIDLSNNKFYGEIPDSLGNLKGLIVLNLSSNSFMSHIPSSFGNLTELESLDLSQNLLSGEIPQQLTSLTFLEYLNLSQNHLIGPIPQGGQLSTFPNSSFEGNLELCGSPLLKKCVNNEAPTSTPSHESSFGEGFNWKTVVMGYACGLVIGLVTGHVVVSRRPEWFKKNLMVFQYIGRESMEDSQSDSNMFSIRIVSIDYYMATPISGLDVCYRSFQGAITEPVDFTVTGPSQVHTGPWICMPNTIDSAAFMGHREIYNVKESGFGGTAIDCSMYESGHNDEPSLVWVHDKSFENLVGTNVTTDSMGQAKSELQWRKTVNLRLPHIRMFVALNIKVSVSLWGMLPYMEEYDRIGMCDGAMPSYPSKPLPDDVLRTLSLGLEFENKLIELCGETENTLALNPLEKNAADKEALGLLRWLAMSQVAEYINSDDELVLQSLAGQQTNFHEAYEVKAAHSDSSMYGKLPLLYSSDSSSQASRAKDGKFVSQGKPKAIDSTASMGHHEIEMRSEFEGSLECQSLQDVGARLTSALVGNNVPLVDSSPLKGSASSLIVTQSSLRDDCDKAQSFLPNDCEKDLPESGSTFYVKPILDHLYQETPESSMQKGVHLVMGGDAYTQAKSFALEIALKVMLVQSDNMYMVAALSDNPIESLNLGKSLAATARHRLVGWMAFLVLMKEVGDEAKIGAITAPMDFTITDWTDGASENASFTLTTSNIKEENFDGSSGAPGGNNVTLVDSSPLKCSASSLIGTPSSLPHDCDKVQSFLPDDCDKDLPESGSGSHVKPILDHLYQENPRIFDREWSAFGDGVTTIMQDGKLKPTPLSQSGFRDPASVGGGEQLTLLSIEVQAESSRDLISDPQFDAINVIALAIQNDTDSIPEVYVLLRSKTEGFKRYGC
uniref:Uncharacterized protein n=1 Tax=Fagus sylvatica TaxID=28930 RepID=A0A2N9I2P3_FAGSY